MIGAKAMTGTKYMNDCIHNQYHLSFCTIKKWNISILYLMYVSIFLVHLKKKMNWRRLWKPPIDINGAGEPCKSIFYEQIWILNHHNKVFWYIIVSDGSK